MKILIGLSLQCVATSAASLLFATPTGRSKDRVLHELNAAVVAADGQAVLRLTDELKALVPVPPAAGAVAKGGKPAAAAGEEGSQSNLRAHLPSAWLFQRLQEQNASTGFLVNRGTGGGTGALTAPDHFKTITVTFKPGKLGLMADWKNGNVTELVAGSQAEVNGIKPGMIFKAIDGEKYAEGLLDKKAAGKEDYTVTLAIPGTEASIFEDIIFQMGPEAKQEVLQQLQSKEVADSVSWIRTGGWYHCAYDTQPCKCVGQVRYGTPHTHLWSDAKHVSSGAILCSKDIFGDPAPGEAKQCSCHRSSFTFTKNENSVSYLQEAWIFMLRLLARMKLLPFTGDRRYHGIELWSARHGGHTGGTLERYWIEKYIVEQYSNIPGGTCLEWGFYYVNWLSHCTNNYENKYEAVLYGQKKPSVEGNVVYGSIYDFPAVVGGAGLQFNFICATELFEHLEKPYAAAAALYKILAPGGAVLFTVPQQAQYHKVPQDFLRYTKEGVKHVMEMAGFCVPNELMAGSGDFIFDVARNTGLQIQDFTIEELDEGYQRGYDAIADGAITIHAMAYKPPHKHCR